jgi:hypothetical protein
MTLDLERKLADIDRQLMANIDRMDKIDRIPDNSSIFHAAMLAVVSNAGGAASWQACSSSHTLAKPARTPKPTYWRPEGIDMTIIDSQGVEAMRIRLDHVERELTQIKTRLRSLPLPEPMPFPVTPRTTPISHSQYYCSFCGKGQEEVMVLIALPGAGNFICNECVTLCHEIVQKRLAKLEGKHDHN